MRDGVELQCLYLSQCSLPFKEHDLGIVTALGNAFSKLCAFHRESPLAFQRVRSNNNGALWCDYGRFGAVNVLVVFSETAVVAVDEKFAAVVKLLPRQTLLDARVGVKELLVPANRAVMAVVTVTNSDQWVTTAEELRRASALVHRAVRDCQV